MVSQIDTNTISGSSAGMSIAEETSRKVVSGSAIWREVEANEFEDTGAEYSRVRRSMIGGNRQMKRGALTGLEASGGFTMDITKNNFAYFAQGFMFSTLQQNPSTLPLNGAQVPVTSVAASGVYNAASGLGVFPVGSLVAASGFSNGLNNGMGKVTAASGTSVTLSRVTAAEAAPTLKAKLDLVGYEFASADVAFAVSGGLATLTATAGAFNDKGLSIGEWVFVGDTSAFSFAVGGFYGRISSVAAKVLTLDKVTFATVDAAGAPLTIAADPGTGKTIRVYVGNYLRNERTVAESTERSYQIERSLGSDANGLQAEYVTGCLANELEINIESQNKVEATLNYIGCNVEYRDGTQGLKPGTRIAGPNETALNTSTDVFRMQMNVIDNTSLVLQSQFAYLTEVSASINNNANPNEAIGTLGAIGITAGDFEVSGSITAYFTTVKAQRAVRANASVTFDIIIAAENGGFILDMPLLELGGGMATVERNEPITIDLDQTAVEGPNGYSVSMMFFPYLPNAAMPV